ncbi:MAG: hypothetical protein SVW77_03170 [Candidatus Nanohaloarchaea archaeon]|nr:hypothetical protein [Candidatus Nanohaloarchaea archaeon]
MTPLGRVAVFHLSTLEHLHDEGRTGDVDRLVDTVYERTRQALPAYGIDAMADVTVAYQRDLPTSAQFHPGHRTVHIGPYQSLDHSLTAVVGHELIHSHQYSEIDDNTARIHAVRERMDAYANLWTMHVDGWTRSGTNRFLETLAQEYNDKDRYRPGAGTRIRSAIDRLLDRDEHVLALLDGHTREIELHADSISSPV